MKKFINNFVIMVFVSIATLTLFFGITKKTSAIITTQYYGGLRAVNVQCTCSAASLLIIYDFKTKMVVNLGYYPGYSRLFEYYDLYTSTYLLGSYEPTLSAGICMFTVGTGCVDAAALGFPLYGTLDFFPGTGTSPAV